MANDEGPSPGTGLVLAIDTAGREGSLALARRGEMGELDLLVSTRLRREDEHAALLVPRIGELLEEVGSTPSDLTGVVVGAGPGSFTGVRVGVATAKGLAWALGLDFWAFSSLAGAALALEEESLRPCLVLFDARGDRLYAAAYRVAHHEVETLLEPVATTVGEIMDGLIPPGAVLMGDGALRHKDILEGGGSSVLPLPMGHPSAPGLLRLLSLAPDTSPVQDVGGWNPDYLRESGAERLWKTNEVGE